MSGLDFVGDGFIQESRVRRRLLQFRIMEDVFTKLVAELLTVKKEERSFDDGSPIM